MNLLSLTRRCKSDRIEIDRDACENCGLCAAACPENVLVFRQFLGRCDVSIRDADACTGCLKCADVCLNQAIRPPDGSR